MARLYLTQTNPKRSFRFGQAKLFAEEKGQTLLIALVLLIFVSLLAVIAVIYAYTSSIYTARVRTHIRALEAAESGLNYGIYQLNSFGADLPTEIDLPEFATRGETIDWLLSLSPEYYRENGNYRFYLDRDGQIIGVGHDLSNWRAVRVSYYSYYFPGDAPSALYVDANNVNSNYNGNSFLIDGRDHDINGNLTSGTDKVGIVTTSPSATSGITPSKSAQKSKIRGSTSTPSITTDPTRPIDISAYTENIGAIADYVFNDEDDGVVDGEFKITPALLNDLGIESFGTEEYPVIVQVNADLEITGNVEGYGIFHLNGSLLGGGGTIVWHGIFVVEGENAWVHGTPDVIGSMWVKSNNLDWRVSGNPNILYSSDAIDLFGSPGYYIDPSTWEEL